MELNRYENKSVEEKLSHENAFDLILTMAKANHPQFWVKFSELYPNFQPALLAVNNRLRISELTLCAYIYLGFSTKEIANYTFRSPKTIENNRVNLRRKLMLTPEDSFSVWIRKQLSQS